MTFHEKKGSQGATKVVANTTLHLTKSSYSLNELMGAITLIFGSFCNCLKYRKWSDCVCAAIGSGKQISKGIYYGYNRKLMNKLKSSR